MNVKNKCYYQKNYVLSLSSTYQRVNENVLICSTCVMLCLSDCFFVERCTYICTVLRHTVFSLSLFWVYIPVLVIFHYCYVSCLFWFAFGIYLFVTVHSFQHVPVQDFIYGLKVISGVYTFFYPCTFLHFSTPDWGSKGAL